MAFLSRHDFINNRAASPIRRLRITSFHIKQNNSKTQKDRIRCLNKLRNNVLFYFSRACLSFGFSISPFRNYRSAEENNCYAVSPLCIKRWDFHFGINA